MGEFNLAVKLCKGIVTKRSRFVTIFFRPNPKN